MDRVARMSLLVVVRAEAHAPVRNVIIPKIYRKSTPPHPVRGSGVTHCTLCGQARTPSLARPAGAAGSDPILGPDIPIRRASLAPKPDEEWRSLILRRRCLVRGANDAWHGRPPPGAGFRSLQVSAANLAGTAVVALSPTYHPSKVVVVPTREAAKCKVQFTSCIVWLTLRLERGAPIEPPTVEVANL